MSKKKAFSGSTMTLKDFHGGSIPSDLPLPSAPGVVVRPSDHRQVVPNAWGNPMTGARSDNNRCRPAAGSSSSSSSSSSSGPNNNRSISNNYDEKSSFFSHPPPPSLININIGRNFDEDERKPLDGGLSLPPRRTVSDQSIHHILPPAPKPQSPPVPKFSGRSTSATTTTTSNPVPVSSSRSPPNAWGTRKDVTDHPGQSSTWSGPNAVSRFAQASALEKVSSGRWQSKPPIPIPIPPEVEVITFTQDRHDHVFNGIHLTNKKPDPDNGWVVEDEMLPLPTRNMSPMYDTNLSFHRDTQDKFGGSHIPIPLVEAMERPKIKLLPRSKPLETLEPIVDYKQGYQLPSNSVPVETTNESYANEVSPRPGSAGTDGSRRAEERPRLNLKPRSQSLEQSHEIAEKERKSLFGGARPRELVLKERGAEEVVINNLDSIQSPSRVKDDHLKQDPAVSTPVYGDKPESFLHDQKIGKNTERKDQRADFDRPEQRGSWRSENWRNSREPDKQQQQQERRPELETWRKPVEQSNSSTSDAVGVRYGKAASAVELAQAFSGSNSGLRTAQPLSGQRGAPGLNQQPFSRLTDTRELYPSSTPRRQINGY